MTGLSDLKLKKLKSNWNDKAESMACFAEARFYDSDSEWACYILALNPDDDDEIICIINGFYVELTRWSLKELYLKHNENGEYITYDNAFRPIWASELFKTLNERIKWSLQQ